MHRGTCAELQGSSMFEQLIEKLVDCSVEVGFAKASNDVDKVLAAANASWNAKQALADAIKAAIKQTDENSPQALALHKDNFVLVEKFGIKKGRLEKDAARTVIGGLAKYVGLSDNNKLALDVLRKQVKSNDKAALWLKLIELGKADGITEDDLMKEGIKLSASFIKS